jgi:uncharacterized protein
VALEDSLLKILVCPVDKGTLLYFEAEMLLYNPRLRRCYPINDGVPVLVADWAEAVTTAEHSRLMNDAARGLAISTCTNQAAAG